MNGLRIKVYDETGKKMLEAVDKDAKRLIQTTQKWLKKFA